MNSRSSVSPRARPGRKSGAKSSRRPDADQRIRNTHRRSPEIIDAAARVFAERGYHGATTQDIADILGIRQASLYYYFSSKEVALEIVCTRGVEDFYKAEKAIASGPGSASERLAGLIRSHISPILDRGDFVKVFQTQRHFLPNRSRKGVGRWSRGIERIFEAVIRQGVRTGEFRKDLDPRLSTLAILGMANAVAGWYAKENASIERIGSEFVALLLRGVAVKPRGGRPRRQRAALNSIEL